MGEKEEMRGRVKDTVKREKLKRSVKESENKEHNSRVQKGKATA